MKLTDLLQGIGSPIAFYPDLVPIVGSHEAAIFLCQLTYWHGKQHNRNGWIYKTQEEWFWETNLTDKQQKNAREMLVERGFIEERYRGIPRRLEYRLKEQEFNEIWDAWMVATKLKKDLTGSYCFKCHRWIKCCRISPRKLAMVAEKLCKCLLSVFG